jgi:hypothetical protein
MTEDKTENEKNEEHIKADILIAARQKAKYFFESQELVHCSLITKKWYNGRIIKVKPDYFIIEDREEGVLPIFYIELTYNGITKYQPVETTEKYNEKE